MTETTEFGSERSLRIAHQGGEDTRAVHVDLTYAGTLDVSGHDTGPTVRRAKGTNVFERGIEFTPADLPRLAFALVAEHYAGDFDAVRKIEKLAKRYGITPEVWDSAW